MDQCGRGEVTVVARRRRAGGYLAESPVIDGVLANPSPQRWGREVDPPSPSPAATMTEPRPGPLRFVRLLDLNTTLPTTSQKPNHCRTATSQNHSRTTTSQNHSRSGTIATAEPQAEKNRSLQKPAVAVPWCGSQALRRRALHGPVAWGLGSG